MFVIINPMSSGGATGKKWPAIAHQLELAIGPFQTASSTAPGHATNLVRQALEANHETIVVVGGDGTINEAINGFFRHGKLISRDAKLGIIDGGTGGDFSRNLNLGPNLDQQIAALVQGNTRPVTVGLASFVNLLGQSEERYFAVLCSYGISSAINQFVNTSPRLKRYGASLAFAIAALYTIATFRNIDVRTKIDGRSVLEGPVCLTASCIGTWAGGGMKLAPRGDVHAPDLDFIIAGDIGLAQRLQLFARIYRGTHVGQNSIQDYKGQTLEASTSMDRTVYVDMDGEIVGQLPLTIKTESQTLSVIC